MKLTEVVQNYKFGGSFHCCVGDEEVGDGCAGDGNTVDFVSNDLKALAERMLQYVRSMGPVDCSVSTKHRMVGEETTVGGAAVAIIIDDLESIVGVIFANPDTPEVV